MPTIRRHAFVWSALLAACTTRPEPATGTADHVHRVTTTITLTDTAVLPSPTVDIPNLSTVVWRNRGTAPVQVEIAATTCGGCETVLGFAPAANGARSVAIAPGCVASICFHVQGSFPFVARSGDRDQRGTIRVGAE
jgi:hypothetical protein